MYKRKTIDRRVSNQRRNAIAISKEEQQSDKDQPTCKTNSTCYLAVPYSNAASASLFSYSPPSLSRSCLL